MSTKNIVFFVSIIAICFSGFIIPQAYAASGISSAVADDPDDADAVYSVGDTITITFPAQVNASFASGTMSNIEFRNNFTVTPSDIDEDDIVTGVWNAGATALTITVQTIGGPPNTPPVINSDTVNYDPGGGNIHYNVNGTEFTGATVTLTGDFGLFIAASASGGSCSGDCQEPTLGINNEGVRLVENGFTYNGKPVNVERYFTPYPLITVDVGVQNIAEFKIYDNFGPSNIVHFDLAFGLASGQILSDSKVMIEWDKSFDGKESINVIDPDNVLDNVKLITSEGKCRADSQADDCLLVQVYHTFRAPPEFNIVGTNVWDSYRNPWQNYYNHGIEVIGDSLNPPKQFVGIDNGKLFTLIQIDKTHAVDENGNIWSFDKQWTKDFILNHKIIDPVSPHGIDRNHAYFETYLKGQEIVATHKMDKSLEENKIQFKSLKEPFSYYQTHKSRADDGKLQEAIQNENLRAQQLFEYLYVKKSHPSFYP